MQKDVVSVRPQMSLSELEEVLLRHRIQGAPVVDGERVVGIVSRSDVVRQLQLEESRLAEISAVTLEPFDAEERVETDRAQLSEAMAARLQALTVADVMIPEFVSVPPSASLAQLAREMRERRIHRVLVMEEGRLVGLVSSLDVIGMVADERLVPA